jgi:hypothetical protein
MTETLNQLSLGQLLARYRQLPAASALIGSWRAAFVGPRWLRSSAGPSIALSGMPGWHGKRFVDDRNAVNLLRRGGELRELLPMSYATEASWLDGQPCVAIAYGPQVRLPWRWVRDELRQLDEQHCLCLTFVDLPLLRRLGFPFLLVREA